MDVVRSFDSTWEELLYYHIKINLTSVNVDIKIDRHGSVSRRVRFSYITTRV